MSINGGFLRQENNEQCYLFNYEIGPNLKVKNENYISKCLVVTNEKIQDEGSVVLNYLLHYNHYERLNKIIPEQQSLESSFDRWKRGQEFG